MSRKVAKKFNVTSFPTVSLFRGGTAHALLFKGNPLRAEELLDFLTSEESLQLPDKIERVDAEGLDELVAEETLVAAVFYEEMAEKSREAMEALEGIDDEASDFE